MRATERGFEEVAQAGRVLRHVLSCSLLFFAASACGEATRSGAASSGGSGGGAGLATGGGGAENAAGACVDVGEIPITPAQREAVLKQGCATVRNEVPRLLEFVVDVSASMNEPAPESPGRSKWQVTREALLELFMRAEGPGLPDFAVVGLDLFPSLPGSAGVQPRDVSACVDTEAGVPLFRLGPARSPQRELLALTLQDVVPQGGTPIQDAYRYAQAKLNASTGPGPRTLVLVTDGSATIAADCVGAGDELSELSPEPMLDDMREVAARTGVRTFVLATPGSEPNRAWLSSAAVIGNTGRPFCSVAEGSCHFDLSNTPNLSEELTKWEPDVVPGCNDFQPPVLPNPDLGFLDPTRVSVMLTQAGQTTLLPRACPSCSLGFRVLPDLSVRLCPSACTAYWPGIDTILEIVYGCRK